MRVFTFFLMMLVAAAGTMVGFRLITGRDLVNPADFGVGRQASIATVVPAARAASTPAPQSPTPAANPTPAPTATPVPNNPKIMLVGNTDGQGVYLRKTPKMTDRLQAWVEGTRMEVTGDPVNGDGQKWLKVRAPNGVEGYIPVQYLVNIP